MARRTRYLLVALAPLLALQLLALGYYLREQRALNGYAGRVANSQNPPSKQVQDLVLSFRDKPDNGNDSYFLVPVLKFLRPTPLQVIERGGDCADRSRLLIALLRLRGIPASKWALYNSKGESVHAVVEADVETGKMVADPLFGIWFPKPTGGYYDIAELRANPGILAARLSSLRAQGLEPGADRLEGYKINEYSYVHARTINWNKSAAMLALYKVLLKFIGSRVDQLRRPGFVEEPALMFIYGLAGLELFLILAWLVSRRISFRRLQRDALPGAPA